MTDDVLHASLVTRKIAYVIPAIFFYDSRARWFQTAGYIGPLKIYAADVQGTK